MLQREAVFVKLLIRFYLLLELIFLDKKFVFVFGTVALTFLVFISFAIGVSVGVATDSSNFKDYWVPVLGMVGGCISGVGALAAVAVSLWLAHKQSSEDTEFLDGRFFAATTGSEDFFALTLVSKGKRPAKVRSICFAGEGAKVNLYIASLGVGSTSLPAILHYGDDAMFRFRDDFEAALDNFVNTHLGGAKSRVRVIVSTTVKTYEFKLQ